MQDALQFRKRFEWSVPFALLSQQVSCRALHQGCAQAEAPADASVGLLLLAVREAFSKRGFEFRKCFKRAPFFKGALKRGSSF